VLAEKSRLREAYDILHELAAEHPDNLEILRHYASVLFLLGEDHDALLCYDRIIKVDPNNVEAIHHRGVIFLRQSNRRDAIRCFREYLVLSPDDTDTWTLLLDTLTEMDQPAAVIAAAGEAIQSGVEFAFIYLYRGRALLHERQYNDAILDLRRSRTLDDRNPETHFLLAQAFSERGRLKHSLLSINRTLQLIPGDRRALMLKARLCRDLGEFEEELQSLDQLLRHDVNDFRVIQLKVDNLTKRMMLEEAAECINAYLKENPLHRRGLLLSAEVAEQLQDTDLARSRYTTLFSLNSISAKTYRAYAGFLLRQVEKTKAALVLDRAAEAHPTNADILTLRAIVLQMLNRHQQCIQYLTKFMATHPSPPEMNWLLGKSWYAQRNYSAALQSFQQARLAGAGSSLGPDAPEFKCLMAEAYSLHHLGRTVEGIALLEDNGRRFESYGREFHEILAEFYNHIRAYSKACAIATEGLALYSDSPVLHYRLARCSAALRRKAMALMLDPSLVQTACNDNRFQKYALSPTLNRLLNYHFYRRRLEFLGLVVLVLCIAAVIAWALR
jgi:tetratricopeptide (TPR) repeat protein